MRSLQIQLRAASRGVTLIEIMVAMVVSSIVALGVFAFSSIQQATNTLHSRNVRVQQALDGAMWSMGRDIRVAGLGFARLCTELRVWGQDEQQLINPGAYIPAGPGITYVDPMTTAPMWVLRDGIQAHWDSSNGGTMNTCADFGGDALQCPADMFDVVVAERNYTNMYGVFLVDDADVTDVMLEVATGGGQGVDPLPSATGAIVSQVQQLMPPGSFIVMVPPVVNPSEPVHSVTPQTQRQCALLQVTGDVQPRAGGGWQIPTDGGVSQFNANKVDLLTPDASATANLQVSPQKAIAPPKVAPPCTAPLDPNCSDVETVQGNGQVGAWQVIPVGRLRWSRYAVDYTVRQIPYLVRYDIIGFQAARDPGTLGAVNYPHCALGTCRAPGLHLPGSNDPPFAVAIGPMIEDMQVAVACDGWGGPFVDADGRTYLDLPGPDNGRIDPGAAAGPLQGQPNLMLDEYAGPNPAPDRQNDEWHGNAKGENTSPDCVYYGTGEIDVASWTVLEGDAGPPPAFRMSPQVMRITLIGASESTEESRFGKDAKVQAIMNMLVPVEDRPSMPSITGNHDRFTLTRQFTPKNLRWRNPSVP